MNAYKYKQKQKFETQDRTRVDKHEKSQEKFQGTGPTLWGARPYV